MTCCGITLKDRRRHCGYCRRTIALIRAARCVSCTEPLTQWDAERVAGQCAGCRSRRVQVSLASARLLGLRSMVTP